MVTQIDGKTFKNMIIGGVNALIRDKDIIDAMNVFPVPDGDTGTNMSLTAIATAAEVLACDSLSVGELAGAASSGSLRGARGNSGVILSQLFRGFAKGVEGREAIAAADIARGFERGSETAFKAVLKPKEGTILTVASQLAKKSAELSGKSEDIFELGVRVLDHGDRVLERTRDMLPALKEAGVVDAGAKGLMTFLRGAFESMSAEGELTLNSFDLPAAKPAFAAAGAAGAEAAEADFGYCTEFIINLDEKHAGGDSAEGKLRSFLSAVGESVEIAGYEGIIKIHVHTQHPGTVLERAIKFGRLTALKIENMTEQNARLQSEQAARREEPAETGFVAVSSGEGLAEIFTRLGVNKVVSGGQTMNPSAQDILDAIEEVNARNVFVLPNNKNIVFAARQAAELCAGKNAIVLNAESVPQGIAAMLNFLPDNTVEENTAAMDEGLRGVRTGRVTQAVRASRVNGADIKKGDYIGMLEEEIVTARPDITEAARALLDLMLDDGAGFISIYYGEGASQEDAEALGAYIAAAGSGAEYEIRFGGQPVYEYIISAE